jgi:hypothetical protein
LQLLDTFLEQWNLLLAMGLHFIHLLL